MRSLQDLLDFHLGFNVISLFLITNQLLSAREQSQAYLHVFDEVLQNRIMMHLQIILPNHHPSLPYTINEAYNAAKWVLQGTSASMGLPLAGSAQALSPTTIMTKFPNQGYIKTKQLGSFLSEFTKTIVDTLNTNRSCSSMSGSGPSAPRNNKCLFDGCDAFIRDCPMVEEYVKQGKCQRNHKGKVILSSGAFVPRDTPGEFLKDRIDEWHRCNLNQLAKGVLSGNTSLLGAIVPAQHPLTTNAAASCPILQLTMAERTEAEIFALRASQKEFIPMIKTRTQQAAEREAVREREESHQPEPIRRTERTTPHRSPSPDTLPNIVSRIEEVTSQATVPAMPKHPFQNAKDAAYVPPIRTTVLPVKPVAKKPDVAYRTIPAIHNAAIATKVYNCVLDTPLTITYHELLSLSPEVHSQVRDAVSLKRMPTKDTATPTTADANLLQEGQPTEEELAYLFPDEEIIAFDNVTEFSSEVTMTLAGSVEPDLPDDAIIVDDPIDRYYQTLPKGEKPNLDCLVVAKESMALRAIVPLVNNHLKVEAIISLPI